MPTRSVKKPNKGHAPTRSLERGLACLRRIAAAGQSGLRFSDLCSGLGLPPITVSRLASALHSLGYLETSEDGVYRAGPMLFDLQPTEDALARLQRLGPDILRQLSDAIQQSSIVLHWDGSRLRCAARELVVDSVVLAPPGYIVQTLPWHPAALCCLPPAEWTKLMRRQDPGTRPELAAWLEQERRRLGTAGYAAGHQGSRDRLAAPICSREGKTIGAILVGAPRHAFSAAQMKRVDTHLLHAARAVTHHS